MSVPSAVSEAEARFDAVRRKVGLTAAPIVFVVLLCVPLPGLSPQAHALAAVAGLTVVFWITEAIPLAAAALLGPALAVLLGVAEAKEAMAPFAHPLMFLFLGGFLLASGLSAHGFDRRAALWLISRRIMAGSPRRALIGISCIAFVFSMWLSNTATTAMLIPVAMGLHRTMCAAAGDDPEVRRRLDRFGGGMCLALAYGASLGGLTTPIGTAPNVIAIGLLEREAGIHLGFLHWMSFALPVGIVMQILMLTIVSRRFRPPMARVDGLGEEVARQLATLGAITSAERRAVSVFGLAVVGWLSPSVLSLALGAAHPVAAWAQTTLDEGVVAIVCASLLFMIPGGAPRDGSRQAAPRLLQWRHAQDIDWGTLFLLGGGLALGTLTLDTGLAEAMGRGILELAGPIAETPLGLTAASVLLVVYLTELTSNTATTSMMLPVLMGVATASGLDATPTAIAVTLAASFAFMLPVSTPPNAIAYGTRLVRIDAMVRVGFWLDVLGWFLLLAFVVFVLPVAL